MRLRLPRKFRDSIKPPSGIQIKEAKKAEDKDMDRVLAVISTTSGFRVMISSIA
jgi:hypothetical protein